MLKLETLEKYVKETTGLVVEPYEHGLVVTGSFGKFNISLTITWWWSDNGAYTCNGGIYVKEDYFGVELIEVSKTLKSEEEIIYLIQSMTSSCIVIMEFLRKQREFLNL